MAGRDTWNSQRCCASKRDFSGTEAKSVMLKVQSSERGIQS